jgi:hypothetical protein
MQRNGMERRQNPRRDADHDAAQSLGGQPRSDDDENDLQEPEITPSFLTARELQARDPGPAPGDEADAGERGVPDRRSPERLRRSADRRKPG